MKGTGELSTLELNEIPVTLKTCSIFIVEDSYIVALHLRKTLEEAGYHVSGIADSGEKALLEIEKLKPDVILMDIDLDGELDGIDTAIRAKHFNIPVIYISAFSDTRTMKRVAASGSYGYLVKPFDNVEMINLIYAVLKSLNKPCVSTFQN
jgi:DNA-binding response OmpR family regulator